MTDNNDGARLPDAHQQPCVNAPDPEIFFPRRGDIVSAEPALSMCRRCMIVRECLAYALLHDVAGIWGATTEDQRAELRRRHQIIPQPISLSELLGETA